MSRLPITLLIIVAATAACSGNATLDASGRVALDPEMSADQHAAALVAIETWNASSVTRLTPVIGVDPPAGGTFIHAGPSAPGGNWALTSKSYSDQPRIAIAFAAIPAHQWADAIAHELAHALGVANDEHTETGLLRPRFIVDEAPMRCIDGEALRAVCSELPCSAFAAPTCAQ